MKCDGGRSLPMLLCGVVFLGEFDLCFSKGIDGPLETREQSAKDFLQLVNHWQVGTSITGQGAISRIVIPT